MKPDDIPLLYFHDDLISPGDSSIDRDLGIAMTHMARRTGFDAVAQRVGREAMPLLDAAVVEAPNDVAAWEARGYALWLAGRRATALMATENALRLAPDREDALRDAAFFASNLGRRDLAVEYWNRLLRVNPWQEPTHFNLGQAAAEAENWDEVLRHCQEGLRIDPLSTESRTLLVLYYARTGNPTRARAEFDALLALKPPKEDELRRWFATLKVP
jgi:tetratricopeptide (TPR) repeat protein